MRPRRAAGTMPAALQGAIKRWVTRWVAILGLLGVLPLVLLTPPMQVSDEPQHFERAYQISTLDLVGHARGHSAGAMLPASISEMVHDSLGTDAIDAPRPIVATPLKMTLAGLSRSLDPAQRRFTDFTGAAPYSPLPYVPQAMAIALGRSLGMGPLALLYAARLANALASILMVVLAVRTAPMAREAFAFAGLMPMALFQYASASPDAMTTTSALLFTAIALRGAVAGWNGRTIMAAVLLGAVFCSHKFVYAPLLLIGLVPAAAVARDRVRAVAATGAIVLVAIGATVGWWLMANSGLTLTRAPGTGLAAQLAFVGGHPTAFASILSATLLREAFHYYTGLVGIIGWEAITLPLISYGLALFGMLLAVFIRHPGEPDLPPYAGGWQLLIVAAVVVLVEVALYLTWNPVGSRVILGVQGRYFLPVLGLVLIALRTLIRMPQDAERSRYYAFIVPAIAAFQILILQATVISAYSVF